MRVSETPQKTEGKRDREMKPAPAVYSFSAQTPSQLDFEDQFFHVYTIDQISLLKELTFLLKGKSADQFVGLAKFISKALTSN